MAGLLYKDFVAVKGKIYVAGGVLLLGITMLLRFFVNLEGKDMLLFILLATSSMFAFLFLVVKLEIGVIAVDSGQKQRQYFLSSPITMRQYVASKYVFLLLAFYVVIMITSLMGFVCLIDCADREVENYLNSFLALLHVIASLMLLLVAIELPFFLGFGVKHGTRLKTGLLMLVFFGGIAYLLFGDLTILERFSPIHLFQFLEKRPELLLALQVFLPYLAIGLYYLSYRIACILFARKEWEDD